MKIKIIIKSGPRKWNTFELEELGSISEPDFWIMENEVVEIHVKTTKEITSAVLTLYDHTMDSTYIEESIDCNVFIWKPNKRWNGSYESLFLNYYGIAELGLNLIDINGSLIEKYFRPIDVLASKMNSKNVELMFNYLARLDDDALLSVFQTTKQRCGFSDGPSSPNGNLERLELSAKKIKSMFHDIIAKPITKLIPEQKIVQSSGDEDLDDTSLAWLMSNLSELSEIDDPLSAHIKFKLKYYKANTIQIPELKENTDIYENHVIHGFVSFLISETKKQLNMYNSGLLKQRTNNNLPDGFVSFYDQINKFKDRLLSKQKSRCNELLSMLIHIKRQLDIKIPVTKMHVQRPIVTPKANVRYQYRILFIEYIDWFERNKPDWSFYKNLFAIQSIPKLFESFCYYRVCAGLNKIFNNSNMMNTFFSLHDEMIELTVSREPKYWMPLNSKSKEGYYINSEGQTIKGNHFNTRGHYGVNSHRSPDIVIELNFKNDRKKLIILDAKYQDRDTAFIKSLKECTMKYIHGIHYPTGSFNPVESLTIIHPEDVSSFNSFHSDEYSLFGSNTVVPALQCIGISLIDDDLDIIDRFLNRILEIYNISIPMKESNHSINAELISI